MLTQRSTPGKLESVNGLHHGTGVTAMLGKEVTYDKPDIQQCIEWLRDRLAASLHASRDAVRLTEEGWFYRKGSGDWQRVPWVLYTVDPAITDRNFGGH
jgi:translation elongation factor EF-Ts